jgi:hypothetical protein
VDHKTAQIISITSVLNKLKQTEPESLILNFEESLDEILYDGSRTTTKDESVNHFAFAAFVPPGKHCIVIKDKDKYWYKNVLIEARDSLTLDFPAKKIKNKG